MNFAHVAVVYAGHVPVVPGDRDRIPSRFGDNAAFGGFALPIHAGALREALGFGGCHCSSLIVATRRANQVGRGSIGNFEISVAPASVSSYV